MNDHPDKPPRRMSILGEWIVRRDDVPDVENPYWELEEAEPHPDPSRGCIRRGLCCKSSPGWFAPGEVEQAAAVKGMEPDAFVRKYLIVDGAEVDGEWVHAFAPVKTGRDGEPAFETAQPVDALYRALRGPCIFYDGKGCGIYEARPYECQHYDCTHEPEQNPRHEDIARMWRDGRSE